MNPFIQDFYALDMMIRTRLAGQITTARILPAWDLDWAMQQVQLAPVVFLMYGNYGPGASGRGDQTIRQLWMTTTVSKHAVQPTLAKGQTVLSESGGLPSHVIAALRRWTPEAAYCDPLELVHGPAPKFVDGFLFTNFVWSAQINFMND